MGERSASELKRWSWMFRTLTTFVGDFIWTSDEMASRLRLQFQQKSVRLHVNRTSSVLNAPCLSPTKPEKLAENLSRFPRLPLKTASNTVWLKYRGLLKLDLVLCIILASHGILNRLKDVIFGGILPCCSCNSTRRRVRPHFKSDASFNWCFLLTIKFGKHERVWNS